jgi:transposase
MSIQTISKLTGWDRKTVRKYLLQPNALPEYGPRRRHASKLDPFKPYLEERMRAGVWNAQVLLGGLQERNYTGGYTILKVAVDQKIGTPLQMHEEPFRQMGGVPEEILYDPMKTVWLGSDERGEIVWHPVFLDFARYWDYTAAVLAVSRADEREGRIGSEIPAAGFSLRTTRTRTE